MDAGGNESMDAGGNESMDAGGNLGSATKGSAIELEVAGSGPVSCHFFIPFLPCVVLNLSFICTMVHRHTSLVISNKNLVFIISWCGNFKIGSG